MNHARAIVSCRLLSARGRSGGGIEGRSELLGILRRQDMSGLRFKHMYCLALNRCAQENRLMHS